MKIEQNQSAVRQAIHVLPPRLRQAVLTLRTEELGRVEELRLRVGKPMTAILAEREIGFPGLTVQTRDLEQLIELASHASIHSVLDQICQGYLTIEGGHRVGLCGTAVMRGGSVHNLRALSSVNLRVARQVSGVAGPVLDRLCENGHLESTLILAPPGLGKTTLLRDLIRKISNGEGCRPLQVAVADERGEIAALYQGRPQLDVGERTDVITGCPKNQGLMMLLRSMGPQVLAVDEITAPEDVQALSQAAGCGVTLLATAHGADCEDLKRRVLYREMLEAGLFRKLVQIRRELDGRSYVVEELM